MTNLSSAEWAAWVQGVGSVLAIVAAIFIAWFQHAQNLRFREGEALDRAVMGSTAALTFSVILVDTMAKAVVELRKPDGWSKSRTLNETVASALDLGTTLDLSLTTAAVVESVMHVRALGARALRLIDHNAIVVDIGDLWQMVKDGQVHIDVIRVATEKMVDMRRHHNRSLLGRMVDRIHATHTAKA